MNAFALPPLALSPAAAFSNKTLQVKHSYVTIIRNELSDINIDSSFVVGSDVAADNGLTTLL